MKNKKVLFTATVDLHIIQFHLPYLKFLKDNNYEVHVATNGTNEIDYCDKRYNINFQRKPFKFDNLKAFILLRKIIKEQQYDIIHCHTPVASVITRLASLGLTKNKTKVIYTAHGFHFFKGSRLINWILYYPVEKWLSRYTDTIITINQEDYLLAKNKFHAKQVEFIDGVGIDINKYQTDISLKEMKKLRTSLKLKSDDFVLIYPAELSRRKNQKMIIRCVAQLVEENKNIKLLLPGLDSSGGYYHKFAEELNVSKHIIFLGYRTDIHKLLKISDLSVSTSKQEGLPVNIMEALASGLPVIATDCRGNRDLVCDGINGYLVKIDDDQDLIHKIKLMYDKKIKTHLDEKYSVESCINFFKTKNIYKVGE